MGANCTHKPIAFYLHKNTNKPRYLTSTIMTTEMRILVQQVHSLMNEEDIDRFSSYSIRDEACCIHSLLATTQHSYNESCVGKTTLGVFMSEI